MKKLNHKGFTGFEGALLILVVAALGFAGYTVWQNNKSDNTDSSSQVATKSTQPKTTADPYAGWKTYKSNLGGFSLKYPSEWQLSGYANDYPVDANNITGNESQISFLPKPGATTNSFGLNLTIQDAPVDKTPFDMYPNGKTETLNNKLVLWLEKEDVRYATGPAKSDCPSIRTGTDGTFAAKLNNGRYLLTYGSYCWNERSKTDLSYSQQVDGQEYKDAIQIMKSISFN